MEAGTRCSPRLSRGKGFRRKFCGSSRAGMSHLSSSVTGNAFGSTGSRCIRFRTARTPIPGTTFPPSMQLLLDRVKPRPSPRSSRPRWSPARMRRSPLPPKQSSPMSCPRARARPPFSLRRNRLNRTVLPTRPPNLLGRRNISRFRPAPRSIARFIRC